jgi:Spy/CpxP family protein refolding chaperone
MSADVPSRLHLWSGLIVLGTFLAGAAAGAGLVTWLRPPLFHQGPREGGLPPPLTGLGLTPDQQQKAQAIMERHRPAMEAVLKESFPRLRALRDQVDQELKTILTEPQARKLDEWKARSPQGGEDGPQGFPHEHGAPLPGGLPPGLPGAPPPP